MPNLRYSITALNNSSKESDFKSGTPLVYKQSKQTFNNNALAVICKGGQVVTVDWYYQIWANGILIYEEYLYSTTECLGGTSSGFGGGNLDLTLQLIECASSFVNQVQLSSILYSSQQFIDPNGLSKRDRILWRIFTAVTWHIDSYDDVFWKRNSTNEACQYDKYERAGDTEVGFSVGGTRTYSLINPYAVSYVSSVKIYIGFSVTNTVLCQIPGTNTSATIIIPPVTNTYTSNIRVYPQNVPITYY